MFLLVALTGLVGLLASFTLLKAGLVTMWLRYPLALCVAYGCFLLSLWWWTRNHFRDWFDADPVDSANALTDLSASGSSNGAASPADFSSAGGGSFGGGGASGGFDSAVDATADRGLPYGVELAPERGSGGHWASNMGDGIDADEAAIPLLIIALILGVALSSLWVVYTAPALMAELLIDGVLASTLYRRLHRLERHDWLGTAVRKTIWPVIVTGIFLALLGWAIAKHAPGADSIGDLWQHQETATKPE